MSSPIKFGFALLFIGLAVSLVGLLVVAFWQWKEGRL